MVCFLEVFIQIRKNSKKYLKINSKKIVIRKLIFNLKVNQKLSNLTKIFFI